MPRPAIFLVTAFVVCFAAVSARAASVPDRHGMQIRLAACAACHGKRGEGDMGRHGGVYPRLAGQPVDYLYRQMLRFKSERRTGIPPVAVMHRLLASLPEPYLRLIAGYYNGATAPYPPRGQIATAGDNEGRELVTKGLPEKDIAPCTSCHGADLGGHPPDVPVLAGQYARYLEIQFAHWAQGARHNRLHEHIARVLTTAQVQAVAGYLATLRRPQSARTDTGTTSPDGAE